MPCECPFCVGGTLCGMCGVRPARFKVGLLYLCDHECNGPAAEPPQGGDFRQERAIAALCGAYAEDVFQPATTRERWREARVAIDRLLAMLSRQQPSADSPTSQPVVKPVDDPDAAAVRAWLRKVQRRGHVLGEIQQRPGILRSRDEHDARMAAKALRELGGEP